MTVSYFDTANKLKLEGRLEEAIASYHQAIEEKPNFYWSYQNLGDALAKLGRWEEAVNAYQSAIKVNSSLPWVHYSLGEAWEKLGRLDEAIACYKKAIELNPEKEWEIHRTLGKVLQRRSEVDLANAISMYRRIIELNPGSVEAYQNLLRLQPDSWELWWQFAQVLVQPNQIEEAIAAYQKVIAINNAHIPAYQSLVKLQPEAWELWWQLGQLLEQENQIQEAIAAYQKVIAINNAHILAYQSLVKLQPEAWELWWQLGQLLEQENQIQEALAAYQKVIAINNAHIPAYQSLVKLQPEAWELWWQLGQLLEQENQSEGAIAAYQKAIVIHPNLAFNLPEILRALNSPTVDQLEQEDRLVHTSLLREKALKLNRLVAIVFYGRSGSMFMQSLLDSHPSIATTPGTYLIGFYEFWDAYGHLPVHELIAGFVECYYQLFDPRLPGWPPFGSPGESSGFTKMGADRNQSLGIDKATFIQHLTEILSEQNPISRKFFFQAVHIAYQECLERPATGIDPHIILFSMHVPESSKIEKIVSDFPDSLFLHVVRYPVQSLGSHFAHHADPNGGNYALDLTLASRLIEHILFDGVPMLPQYKDRSRAVKLEDLHRKPRETLEKLCTWLGIAWNDILLKSTFDGLQWWNVQNSPQISGFSEVTIAKQHKEYLTSFDKFRLNVLLSKKCRLWNYDIPQWYGWIFAKILIFILLIIPFKMELISFFDSPMKNTLKVHVQGIFESFIECRKMLWRAWRHTFKSQENELDLL